MSENIRSHGQTGGITAHTVNIGGAPGGSPEPPRSGIKKIIAWIAGAVAFAASVVAIFEYVGLKPSERKNERTEEVRKEEAKPMSQQPQNINVTSLNQQGGITAHTVNVVNPRVERHLDDRLRGQIDTLVREHKELVFHVHVVSGSGDEAMVFATEIKSYMDRIGARTIGVDVSMFGNPAVGEGTHVFKEGDGINVIIGRAPLK